MHVVGPSVHRLEERVGRRIYTTVYIEDFVIRNLLRPVGVYVLVWTHEGNGIVAANVIQVKQATPGPAKSIMEASPRW